MGGCILGWVRRRKVDKIVVQWPSGREQTLEGVDVDRVLTVEEPQ